MKSLISVPKRFMKPHLTNNRRPAVASNVKFTLAVFACALSFCGMIAIAADNVGRPTAPIARNHSEDERPAPLFGDGKFLQSLRFWERNKRQPQPHVSHSQEETSTRAERTPSEQSDAPVPPHWTTTDTAPEPPPNPYAVRENAGGGDAPLPEGPLTNLTYELDSETAQGGKPSTGSHVLYSSDTRDWVEFFHQPLEEEGAQSTPSENTTPEVFIAETPAATLWSPPTSPQQIPTSNAHDQWNADDQWNGHATMLVTYVERSPVHIAPPPVVPPAISVIPPAVSVAAPSPPDGKPQIDMSPSYGKRLPHVTTCGVVVVQANFPLTEIASILDEIAQLQHDLNRYIGVPAPQEKIELCLFRNEETYIEFLREFFPRAPRDRRALYVKLDNKPGTLMVQKSKDFEVDLRHEMTHAIVHASIPKVPIWLDEGLAKYFEVPPQDRADNHPYMAQIRWSAKLGSVPSLDRLAKLETIDDMGSKEYRDSWAWTHFLIHRSPETHRLLAAYLQMLATWTGSEGEYAAMGNDSSSLGGRFFNSIARGREKQAPTPSLKLYLDDIMENQREMFKEHFGSVEK